MSTHGQDPKAPVESYAAIIFDMDSTVVDSLPAIRRTWTDFAIRYGITEEQLMSCFGHSTGEIIDRLIAEPEREAARTWMHAKEISDQEGVVALPGAHELLTTVGERGAIATSATREMALARLEAAGLPIPQVLVTASDVERAKPDPQIFLRAAELLAVAPHNCLVAEDSPAGLQAGRAGGMHTVAVTTTHTPDQVRDLSDVIVTDLSQVRVHRGDGQLHVHYAERL